MLRSLYIKNFALIEELEVQFEEGLNILTGETGAGKSIVIGALQLILGARASTDSVRSGSDKAIVEGVFTVPADGNLNRFLLENGFDTSTQLILRREVTGDASRAFVNDSPATLQLLRELTSGLVDLHGQHDHQSLLREETHLDLLDVLADTDAEMRAYRDAFARVDSLNKEIESLRARRDELEKNRELAAFQIEEIDRVSPEPGEEERLDQELKVLDHAEQLIEGSVSTAEALYTDDDSLYDRLAALERRLEQLARFEARFEPHVRDLQSALAAISEVATFLRDYGADLEFDPARIEEVRERLGAFEHLKRKYGGSIEAVVEHRSRIGEDFQLGSNLDEKLTELSAARTAAQHQLGTAALALSEARAKAAPAVEQAVVKELDEIGMPGAVFRIQLARQSEPHGWALAPDGQRFAARPDGIDECAFHISTNRGEPAKALVRVASGGEVSRVMLALKKVLARADSVPTLIFDEIDTGISGAVAQKVGGAMRRLAENHQIVAITHLPQIAAMASVHYRVRKEDRNGRNVTTVERLSDAERTREVASLLSGAEVSSAAIKSAEELISLAGEIA